MISEMETHPELALESTPTDDISCGTGTRTRTTDEPKPGERPVIFFDGVCGLCSRWVDFVLRWDRRQEFRFSPLQGETARDWLQIEPGQSLNSVVLVDETGIHRKSDAIWRMLRRLGGRWIVPALLLRLTPTPVRNFFYDQVARHRYQWFGKKETCRMPTPAERSRFLP